MLGIMSSKKSAKDILCFSTSQIHCQIHGSLLKSVRFGKFLIASKILDARRRGATSEAYGATRRKEERSKATPPFGFAQDRESFDFAQDREPVERLVEWQMMP
jgi:hypothetical protein